MVILSCTITILSLTRPESEQSGKFPLVELVSVEMCCKKRLFLSMAEIIYQQREGLGAFVTVPHLFLFILMECVERAV